MADGGGGGGLCTQQLILLLGIGNDILFYLKSHSLKLQETLLSYDNKLGIAFSNRLSDYSVRMKVIGYKIGNRLVI